MKSEPNFWAIDTQKTILRVFVISGIYGGVAGGADGRVQFLCFPQPLPSGGFGGDHHHGPCWVGWAPWLDL